MIRAIRSQWIRLRRRSVVLGWGGAMVGFALVATILTLRRLGGGSATGPGAEQALTVAGLSTSDGVTLLLGVTATFLGVLTLGLFATVVANDYAQGTIRTLLLEQPRRLRLLVGQLLALAAFTSLFVVVASLATFAVGLVLAPNQGVDTAGWLTTDGYAALAGGIGNLILACLGWALMGTLLAVLFRSPAPAIATGAAYALPGEALLVGSWDDAAQWLPRSLMDALAAGGTPLVSYGHAATLFALYGSVAFLLIAVLFVRRDVTA